MTITFGPEVFFLVANIITVIMIFITMRPKPADYMVGELVIGIMTWAMAIIVTLVIWLAYFMSRVWLGW